MKISPTFYTVRFLLFVGCVLGFSTTHHTSSSCCLVCVSLGFLSLWRMVYPPTRTVIKLMLTFDWPAFLAHIWIYNVYTEQQKMAIIIVAEVTKSEHIRVRMFLWFWVGFSSFLAAKRNAITLVSIALAIVPLSVCWCICASVCVCVFKLCCAILYWGHCYWQ